MRILKGECCYFWRQEKGRYTRLLTLILIFCSIIDCTDYKVTSGFMLEIARTAGGCGLARRILTARFNLPLFSKIKSVYIIRLLSGQAPWHNLRPGSRAPQRIGRRTQTDTNRIRARFVNNCGRIYGISRQPDRRSQRAASCNRPSPQHNGGWSTGSSWW